MKSTVVHLLAAQLISDYLTLGMHHNTKESLVHMALIVADAGKIHISVGDKVSKLSGKPFKSGDKVNTVKEFTINPNTQKIALTFIEDDSIVDAYICERHFNNEDL